MAATLQSILGANLPQDMLPDDTTVVYEESGHPAAEVDFDDPDNEPLVDSRNRRRYIDLALAFYNDKNNTGYKAVEDKESRACLHEYSFKTIIIRHCGFTAVDCESSTKNFFAELEAERSGEEVVTSCRIIDGLKTTGCEQCDIGMCEPCGPGQSYGQFNQDQMEVDRKKSWEDDLPLSKYSHCLADGVTLSEKARLRLPFPLLALAYYNKKNRKDYKLVDALPNCFSLDSSYVLHCNFIARQNAPEDDVSNKLFFAEFEKREEWGITACRIINGKTTAGCNYCAGRQGKRVIHPTHGFRFGLYRPTYRHLRRRRHQC